MFTIQGVSTSDSIDSYLPGNNYPSWLAYMCEGPSIYFQVPKDSDCGIKGITLCVIYSSALENIATEFLASVVVINYTKFTIKIYKRDIVISFNDDDWKSLVSNLEVGDNVEIFVAFGHGLTVKEMAVYLIYGQSTAVKMESTLTVKTEPSPKPNEKIFGRIAKSVRGCFCLNKSHHNHDFPPLPPLEFRWLQCHQHWMFEGRFNFKMVF
jgi:hypothetical protein